jgi:hypothetical protein
MMIGNAYETHLVVSGLAAGIALSAVIWAGIVSVVLWLT